MQQRIGFCSTADGARIAYATVGTGPVLIFAQWVSHLELEWEEPRVRHLLSKRALNKEACSADVS